ncbi:MAG TPA: beta-ketoacyl-ACP synthase III, partial [Ghiorsea sp.]|nr:beta-ketoacyl-ACP synthase III [Ghiorsea sp.]
MTAVISATGLWTPKNSISNEELVIAFNAWSNNWNAEHADAIAAGEVEAKPLSSAEFIEKASGITSRYVISKDPIL